MKYKNILKISIVLLLLLVSIGSIYATDNIPAISNEDGGVDDFELDEDYDDLDYGDFDDLDDVDDSDDDLDDLGYGDFDDLDDVDDLDDLDYDDSDDEDFDDVDDLDYDDLDDWDDYNYTDFDFLKLRITYYLDNYGNCSSYNWTENEEFLNGYQLFLANPDTYILNESAEGYETYLKIYESIISTFEDYNLTKNETDYLKFMIIFYLNNYGNVSANYTWNESESFENYIPMSDVLLRVLCGIFNGNVVFKDCNNYLSLYNPSYASINNPYDFNQTSITNHDSFEVETPSDFNVFVLMLVFVLVMLLML